MVQHVAAMHRTARTASSQSTAPAASFGPNLGESYSISELKESKKTHITSKIGHMYYSFDLALTCCGTYSRCGMPLPTWGCPSSCQQTRNCTYDQTHYDDYDIDIDVRVRTDHNPSAAFRPAHAPVLSSHSGYKLHQITSPIRWYLMHDLKWCECTCQKLVM